MIDATHLELAEPVDLPAGRKPVLSLVDAEQDYDERQQWLAASEGGLQEAYSDSEPEYFLDPQRRPACYPAVRAR